MFGGLGIWELVIILMIILIIFGAGKLPEIGGGLGKAIRNFKKATSEVDAQPAQKNQQIEEKEKKDA
jgi:sec-independent protein translocase protein TatA